MQTENSKYHHVETGERERKRESFKQTRPATLLWKIAKSASL